MNKEEKSMGFLEKLVGIFTSPAKVMEDLKEHPKMLWALIYASIISILIYFLKIPMTLATQENMARTMSERYGMDMSEQMAMSTQTMGVAGIIGAIVGIFVAWIIGGLVYWMISKIFKGKSSLNQILSVNSHVLLLTTTVGLLAAALTYVLKLDVDVFSFAILSPNGDMSSFLYSLLYVTTINGIWGVIVTGIGLSVVNEFSRAKGYITSFIVYLLTVLIGATSTTMAFWMLDMTTRI